MKVYKGTSILMLSIVVTTILLMIFPQIRALAAGDDAVVVKL